MTIKILMPALSPTMTEGNLAKWHVGEGDRVNPGDVIAEIETDKASMEVEAVDEGTVGRLLVASGTFIRASAQARTTKSFTEILVPSCASLSALRTLSNSSISQSIER